MTLVANNVEVFLINMLNKIIAAAVPKTESTIIDVSAELEKELRILTDMKSVVNK